MGYGWGMRVVEIPCAFLFEKKATFELQDLRRLATVLRNNSLTGNSLLRKELPHIHLLLQAQVGHHLLSRLLLSPPLPHLLCIGSFISIVCELFFQPLNFHSFLPCDIHMYQVADLSMLYHDLPYDMYITWKSVKPCTLNPIPYHMS
jgi:hypothetical protein